MTDDKADNITKPEDEVATTANPDAQPTEAQAEPGAGSPDAGTEENKLGGLMAESEVPTAKAAAKPAVNLEADAMRAAEEALAEGEKALAEANAQLQEDATPRVTEKPKSRQGGGQRRPGAGGRAPTQRASGSPDERAGQSRLAGVREP